MFQEYLIKYGYLAPLDPNLGGSKTEKQLKDAVKLFQRVAGIPQTGDLTDSRTLQMIHQPRCGMSDFKQSGVQARRHKRYVLQGSKWNKKVNRKKTLARFSKGIFLKISLRITLFLFHSHRKISVFLYRSCQTQC